MVVTVQLDEAETDALRARAEREGRSVQEVARQAVRENVERTARRDHLDAVLDEELPRYADALRRLGATCLDLDDLLHVAGRVLGAVEVRDLDLLDSAATRPRTTVFGADAYPTTYDEAAALIHSVARNHALVDGNERLTLAAGIAFPGVNGLRLTLTEDEAYHLIIAVASGGLDDVPAIAARLRAGTAPWEERSG